VTTRSRKRTPAALPRPACAPFGDFRPWLDDQPRRCTVCGVRVVERALPDGSDWLAVDTDGSPIGTADFPPLCDCPDVADLGRIAHRRHYGHGLPAAAWFGGFHTHNALGGDQVRERPGQQLSPCFRMPPTVAVASAEPVERRPELVGGVFVVGRGVPTCCGQPMRYAPRGWNCRVNGSTWVVPDVTRSEV
jgi:hypothetical protein